MARNRKSQATAIRVGAAIKALLLCVLIGGSAVGYVWQQEQEYQLGKQSTKLETQLEALRRHNKSARDTLAVLCLPNQIAARVHKMDPGLEPAQPGQYLRLPEPLVGVPGDSASDESGGRGEANPAVGRAGASVASTR